MELTNSWFISEAIRGQILSERKLLEISSHIVWGIHTFMCFIWCAEDCELEFVLELLLLKNDHPLNMPEPEAPELEFDELEDDDHAEEPDLFEVEDEVLRPWEAEFLLELILMPTEKTTQLALLAETQAHMEKILKMLLKLLLLIKWMLMFNWFANAGYKPALWIYL